MSGPQIHGGYICVDDNRFCRFWLIDQIRGRNIDRFGTWGNDMLLSQNKAIWKEGWVGIRDRKKNASLKGGKTANSPTIHNPLLLNRKQYSCWRLCLFVSCHCDHRQGRARPLYWQNTHLILQALSQTLNRKISSSDSDWLFKWAFQFGWAS